ncbi:hypothetical protein Tco_1562981 [Tanacetum coccineum]
MACSIPHSDDEIQALVQKQIDEDMVHQKAILDLALQFDNACTTKEDLKKAYEKCNHIPQESRALIDTFLKEGSDKDYELNLSMYRKAAKLKKQMNAKLAWIHEKYNHRSETHIGGDDIFPGDICRWGKVAKRQKLVLRGTNSRRLINSKKSKLFPGDMSPGIISLYLDQLFVLKVMKNSLEALKVLKNSLEVLKVLQMELH